MRIALNLLYLLPGRVGGTQTYAEELIAALANIDDDNEYLLFLNKESADLPLRISDRFERIVCPVEASNRKARYLYEQLALPRMLRRYRVNVVHSLAYVGPLYTPCPHIISIHDLNYRAFGAKMSGLRQGILSRMVPLSARHSDRIITISEFSKREIVEHIGISPDKITVIYHGAPEQNAKQTISSNSQSSKGRQESVLESYAIHSPYLIAFGSLSPNKNTARLLDAFTQLKTSDPYELVIVGHLPEDNVIQNQIAASQAANRIHVTGYVPDEDVPALLRQAKLFVFPSLYEGFGLPALEAQSVGTPVVCSKAASLPEVAGEAALYFDPMSVDDMKLTIEKVLNDVDLQNRLIEKGYDNAARFSWHKAAEQTLSVYRQLCHTPFRGAAFDD